MISKQCRIADFVGAVRNKDYFEIIDLANREATEAERLRWRMKVDEATRQRCGREYAEQIKQLIDYMRYEARPRPKFTQDVRMLASLDTARRPRRGL
jgi:hypothetical protein